MTRSAVQLSDEFLRTLLDIAPDAIALVRGATILYMSPAGARMLGFSSSRDLVGTSLADWLDPEDFELAAQRIRAILRADHAFDRPHVYRAHTRDGQGLTLEVASVPITYEGEPAVLSFVRDVTHRQALERQLTESSRLAALGRLSAGVAHELNSPLTHLVLSVDGLRRTLGHPDAEQKAGELLRQTRERLDQMAHELDRMVLVARELRLFASPQARSRGPVDLRQPLESALREAQGRSPTAAAAVTVTRSYQDIPAAAADPHRMEQVLGNLVRNAFESLVGDGPGRDEGARVTLALRQADPERVAIDVIDNGPGIAAAELERIFEPFFTTKAYGKGAGLGLAISRSIVQALGGTLEVDSAPGRGTRFSVLLPAWRPSASDRPERPPDPGVPVRILVVDDEVAIGRALVSLLGERHQVVTTTSAAEALAVLDQDRAFDVILCDVVMPGASGLDFLEQLRARHPQLERRVVFMTGATLGSDHGRALEALPHTVLEKPFDVDQLESTLQAAARG